MERRQGIHDDQYSYHCNADCIVSVPFYESFCFCICPECFGCLFCSAGEHQPSCICPTGYYRNGKYNPSGHSIFCVFRCFDELYRCYAKDHEFLFRCYRTHVRRAFAGEYSSQHTDGRALRFCTC